MVMKRKGKIGGAPSGDRLTAGAMTFGFEKRAPKYIRKSSITT